MISARYRSCAAAILLLGVGAVLCGCYRRSETSEASGTWRLDALRQTDPQSTAFVDTVKRFYTALQAQDWRTTYDLRTAPFHHDVSWDLYQREMQRDSRPWSLDRYEVLAIDLFGNSSARLIMSFDERGSVSYNAVWWKKEDGQWKCEEAGPREKSLFRRTRSPQE